MNHGPFPGGIAHGDKLRRVKNAKHHGQAHLYFVTLDPCEGFGVARLEVTRLAVHHDFRIAGDNEIKLVGAWQDDPDARRVAFVEYP